MKYVLSACAGFLAVVALSLPSFGSFVSIAGLKNTGVNSNNTVRNGGLNELHYDLVSFPSGYANEPPLNVIDLATNSTWLANTNSSKWISVGVSSPWNANDLTGTYFIDLAFDLTGFNHNTASFTGRFASDNAGTVFLNGSSTPLATTSSNTFSQWTNFSATSGFVSGMNMLRFSISNAGSTNSTNGTGNPMGLRVEFLQSAVQVPEPATMALWGVGAVGLAAFRFRRKK